MEKSIRRKCIEFKHLQFHHWLFPVGNVRQNTNDENEHYALQLVFPVENIQYVNKAILSTLQWDLEQLLRCYLYSILKSWPKTFECSIATGIRVRDAVHIVED